ncbi:Bug family tripartite tricarboxylate transporter substrate binding protein [Roseateles oligotrophus]|uniref:Tripartite tricarboxylate transporter substrate binding protein n=1 Tax=Roseateles oligotrophus TaxID=1769250 RepID=A0ABT2YE16_9BURK|nr:tripartite tricarboxylate transporter substrate binding protein [Roseateles oligotrophus]MCV2368301.1 tripartite tricarboxylate transporter substrate binding protein [Roseateles oligotrophus]
MRRRELVGLGLAGLSLPLLGAAWPQRPIKLLVPFPAGSSPDLIARVIAEPLAAALGQAIVIDNRPGAGGNIGTGMVTKAAPDGYTLLFTTQGPLTVAPLLSRRLSYEPLRDLAAIGVVATSPNLLVLDARLGVSSVSDFVRLAKARKGGLNYASIGNGSAAHLAMEDFKARAGIELTHVPYQGFPQVVNALLAGEVQAAFMVPAMAMPQVRAGKLAALAVTSLGRSAALAEFPTLAEQGFAGFEAQSWQALLAPAKTPPEVIRTLSQLLMGIVRSDEMRARLLTHYFSASATTPEGLEQLMMVDRKKWALLIKRAGIQAE